MEEGGGGGAHSCLLLIRLPFTPLGRGVALVRVTNPSAVVVMEDEEEGRMKSGSIER